MGFVRENQNQKCRLLRPFKILMVRRIGSTRNSPQIIQKELVTRVLSIWEEASLDMLDLLNLIKVNVVLVSLRVEVRISEIMIMLEPVLLNVAFTCYNEVPRRIPVIYLVSEVFLFVPLTPRQR